jgi:cellobiose dehydrogenase (acceptor)
VLFAACRAQSAAASTYTDPDTGIVFNTWSATNSQTPGGLTLGLALPSDALTTDATELIGFLVGGPAPLSRSYEPR